MTSPVEQVTQGSRWGALVTYCVSALCVRMLDAGAGVAFLLLAQSRLDPAIAARTGGLLVALFTLPHLAGPLVARRLDLAGDFRRLLGAAYVLMAGCLAVGTATLGALPTVVVAGFVILPGCGGPLLTGGLSSRLPELVTADELSQRRAQGLDATVYGIAGTAGPALVAVVSGRASAATALFVLCGLAVLWPSSCSSSPGRRAGPPRQCRRSLTCCPWCGPTPRCGG